MDIENTSLKYCKDIKQDIEAYYIPLDAISVLEYQRINFFEKAIIVFLQQGLQAASLNKLIDNISIILNIKRDFVDEYIRKLETTSVLKYHKLKEEYNYYVEDSFAVIKDEKGFYKTKSRETTKDFWDLVYIPAFDAMVNKNQLNTINLKLTGQKRKSASQNIKDIITKKQDELYDIINESFGKNFYVPQPLKYDIDDSNITTDTVSITCLLQYDYSDGKSTLTNVEWPREVQGFDFIELENKIKQEYAIDEELPGFIRYRKELEHLDAQTQQGVEASSRIEALDIAIKESENNIKEANKKISLNRSALANKKLEELTATSIKEEIERKKQIVDIETIRRDEAKQEKEVALVEITQINNGQQWIKDYRVKKDNYVKKVDEVLASVPKDDSAIGIIIREIAVRSKAALERIDKKCSGTSPLIEYNRGHIKKFLLALFKALDGQGKDKLANYFYPDNNPVNKFEAVQTISKLTGCNAVCCADLREFIKVLDAYDHSSETTVKTKNNKEILDEFNNSTSETKKKRIISLIDMIIATKDKLKNPITNARMKKILGEI